jgi:F-type H+-transporting ATPase subunit b
MHEAAKTLQSLGVDWYKLGGQFLCFAIILATLWRYAYKPVLAILQQRTERIAESVTNAEKIKAELASTESARQEILNTAAAQANKMIEEARLAAARVQEQETQKAIAQAEEIIAKARDVAAADHARMLGELKREVGALVVQTTAAVTGKVLTPEDQRRLADETRRQLAA